jgi:hypothetical protein
VIQFAELVVKFADGLIATHPPVLGIAPHRQSAVPVVAILRAFLIDSEASWIFLFERKIGLRFYIVKVSAYEPQVDWMAGIWFNK